MNENILSAVQMIREEFNNQNIENVSDSYQFLNHLLWLATNGKEGKQWELFNGKTNKLTFPVLN